VQGSSRLLLGGLEGPGRRLRGAFTLRVNPSSVISLDDLFGGHLQKDKL
jgi:hypothetical protein